MILLNINFRKVNHHRKKEIMKLEEIIKQIKPLDEAAMQSAQARQNMLTKPQGSLGVWKNYPFNWQGFIASRFHPSKIKLSSLWQVTTELLPRASARFHRK
jgi:hypothetical protein